MPDRIIRDELLESERWLSLKDNADRLAFLALLLKADSLGNFTAERYRLMRLWRDYGINTLALVAKTLTELIDHDLIRLYPMDGKELIHIPRFGQRNTRYLKRIYPLSPWTTTEQKQLLEHYAQRDHSALTLSSQPKIGKDRKGSTLGLTESPTRPKIKPTLKHPPSAEHQPNLEREAKSRRIAELVIEDRLDEARALSQENTP